MQVWLVIFRRMKGRPHASRLVVLPDAIRSNFLDAERKSFCYLSRRYTDIEFYIMDYYALDTLASSLETYLRPVARR